MREERQRWQLLRLSRAAESLNAAMRTCTQAIAGLNEAFMEHEPANELSRRLFADAVIAIAKRRASGHYGSDIP